jgi:hypothetical protein
MIDMLVLVLGFLIVLLPRLMFRDDRSSGQPDEMHQAWLIRP